MHALLNKTLELAPKTNRRGFLKLSVGTGVGLIIGASLPVSLAGAAGDVAAPTGFAPFVKIGADNVITVVVKHLDKGQGTASGLATLVAEELDARWDQMSTEFAPANAKLYKNIFWGEVQGTGGSTAIANSFEQYRKAGATARVMLIEAAAKEWNVPASEITVAQPELIEGKRALVVEDGPTLTHGGMRYGAGYIAAKNAAAGEMTTVAADGDLVGFAPEAVANAETSGRVRLDGIAR